MTAHPRADTPAARLQVDVEAHDGRYARQELISWWEQDRLSAARVLVAGAGALGNELLKNLALVGVGQIVVVDLDCIESSNLSRCVLFREEDERQPKAAVAAREVRRLNPQVEVAGICGDLRTAVGLQLVEEADVVLGGLDSREARLHLNQLCWKAGTPWIDGAIEGLMGVMRAFVPPASPCYECTLSARDYEIMSARRTCSLLTRADMLDGKVPTTATSASIIAAMQVQEAVKLLHADLVPYDFAGRGFAYGGLAHDSYPVTYARNAECVAHDTYALGGALTAPPRATLGEILALAGGAGAGADADPDITLELELDVVRRLTCRPCGTADTVLRPLVAVTDRDAACPSCGAERDVDVFHAVTAEDEGLLGRTPAEVGVPPFDVLSAQTPTGRVFIRLAASGTAWPTVLGAPA